MPTKDLFQSMLAFLNFPENVSVVKVRKFLQDEGLCQDELILGDEENTIYSLYSQKEVEARKARGEPVSLSLLQAMKPVEDGKTYSLLTDPAYYRERFTGFRPSCSAAPQELSMLLRSTNTNALAR